LIFKKNREKIKQILYFDDEEESKEYEDDFIDNTELF
jgi:hypothetical protein